MPVTPGSRMGPYEILAPLGEGGMGEVYRARDTKLDRDVALKILPESFANDPDRLMRFEREAKTLAALNHPHIAHIHGLEESAGVRALVMELVEGEDLSQRIARGAIPLDEALPIARQIAEALEAAHDAGIIHRDLKPANIKVRADGTVKVLDFGLAKALDPANSPTFTSPAMTAMGMILGTAAYMAPEQARGKPVDKRADIWAFGVVLYEMLSGQNAFGRPSVTETLAAVIRDEPDMRALGPDVPAGIRRLIDRCLRKDPRARLRDIGDARLELEAPTTGDGAPAARPARFASRPAMALMAALGVAVLALGVLHWRGAPSSGPPVLVQTSIALPPGHALVAGPEITRDGQRIAFVSTDGRSRPQIYTRRLDEHDLHVLDKTEEADRLIFSPDGRWIAFYAQGGFFKVRVDGGEPVRLADAPSAEGACWLEDGTIIFTTAWNSGLYRINANGGTPEPLLVPDRKSAYAYTWPFVTPGEQEVLFNFWGRTDGMMRMSLTDRRPSVVMPRAWRRGLYAVSGHIVFAGEGGDLMALPASASSQGHTAPEPVLANVDGGGDDGYARVSLSESGTLVYGQLDTSKRSLVQVDRSGKMEPVQGAMGTYEQVRLAPDGQRIAVMSNFNVFVQDRARGSRLPLAPELLRSQDSPVWTADGARVVFCSNHEGTWAIYSRAATGTGDVVLLFRGQYDVYPTSVARDGTIVFEENHAATGKDIWLLRPNGKPEPWLVTPAQEARARLSPNERLMAFTSDVSGRSEIYVQALDRSSAAVPVSTSGGTSPEWSASGDRIFFRQGNLMMAATVRATPTLAVGEPESVFDGGWPLSHMASATQTNYAVMLDGRLLMVRNEPEAVPTRINVIFNWFTALNAKVPVN